MEKTCTKCFENKPFEDFPKSKQVKSGRGAWCKLCTNAARRESAERIKAADPDAYSKRQVGYSRAYRERHPDRANAYDHKRNLRRKFGITPEQYDALLIAQDGKCAGCDSEPQNKRFAVDHDHNCCPGQKTCGSCIRGLLCSNCNTALGLLGDNPDTLKALLNYLERK